MADVHVFAKIHPKDEFYDDVSSSLVGIVEATREEAGCKRFELNSGIDGDRNLYLVEIWKDDAALEKHHEMAYTVEAAARIEGKLAKATAVTKMTPVI